MQPSRHPTRRPPHSRAGFTLIELLVVIVVIAILAALLIPAVLSAVTTAREATVVTEISNFDKALTEFKNRYGVEVPSFIVLYEQGDNGAADPSWFTDTMSTLPAPQDAYRRTSKAFIRQVWPDFDFTYAATGGLKDLNGDGDTTDVLVLNGSECLVFFLGGVFTRGGVNGSLDDDALIGFAANPQNPFDSTSSNNRVGPFFDGFAVNRFTDLDGDDMPEYMDGLSGQQRPYVYISGYGGSGYKPSGTDGVPGNADDEIEPLLGLTDAYFKAAGPPKTYLNLQSHQIISPGADTEFGTGGVYDGDNVPSARANERDNITNFKGGRLN